MRETKYEITLAPGLPTSANGPLPERHLWPPRDENWTAGPTGFHIHKQSPKPERKEPHRAQLKDSCSACLDMPFQDVYFTSAFLNQDDWNCIRLQGETLMKYIGLQAMAILFHMFYLHSKKWFCATVLFTQLFSVKTPQINIIILQNTIVLCLNNLSCLKSHYT